MFYPLKNLFVIIVEKFILKHPLNKAICINILNFYSTVVSCFCFLAALYIWLLENKKTKYFFPSLIIFSFVVSNIHVMRTGFNLGYSNMWDFGDFLKVVEYYAKADYFGTNYPPLAVGIYKLMYEFFSKDPSISAEYVLKYLLTLYFLFTVITLFILFQKSINEDEGHKFLLSSVFFLTGPLLFAYQRMNLMHLALIFTMIFVIYYNSPSKPKRFFALFSLAVAANIKYFPAVFGLLLVKEKKWKQACASFIMGVLLFLFPIVLPHKAQTDIVAINSPISITENGNESVQNTPPEITADNTQLVEQPTANSDTVSTAHTNYIVSKINMIFDSTNRFLTNARNHVMASINAQAIAGRTALRFGITSEKSLNIIMTLSLIVFLILSIGAFFIANSRHCQLLILALLAILAPPASAWYGLIFLFIPFLELIKKDDFSVVEHIEFVLYCLIFIFVLDYRFRLFMPISSWHIVLLFCAVIYETVVFAFKEKD